jgi:CheY-like chemotaxis protein
MNGVLLIDESDNTKDFFQETFTQLRARHQALVRADSEGPRQAVASEMEKACRALANTLKVSGLIAACRFAEATAILMGDIVERPRDVSAETLRTVAQALDFLQALCQAGKQANPCDPGSGSVLVVDDEPISRRAVSAALDRVGLKSTAVHQPSLALALLQDNPFDLVVLDISMPEMNGFEMCTGMRALPRHKHTPVIFVTGFNRLENKAASMTSGASDMIGKPFRHAEFGVRALLPIMRAKLAPGSNS